MIFPADTTSVTGELSLWLSAATHIKLRENDTPPKSELFIPSTQLQDVFELLAVLESESPDSFVARGAVPEREDVLNRYK